MFALVTFSLVSKKNGQFGNITLTSDYLFSIFQVQVSQI